MAGLLSSGLGAALGAGQMIAGAIKSRKADKMLPSGPSAAEQGLINQFKQMRRSLLTNQSFGQGAQSARTGKMMANKMFAAGGRNLGGISAQMSENQANIAAQAQQQAAGLLGAEQEAQRYASSIGRDATMLKSNRIDATGESLKQAGGQNLLASVNPEAASAMGGEGGQGSSLLGILGKKKKKNIANG